MREREREREREGRKECAREREREREHREEGIGQIPYRIPPFPLLLWVGGETAAGVT